VVFACTREKRACPACPGEGVTLQPAPVFGLERALAADGLVAKIITDKYADHLPLNRQSRRFLRESGVNIATSTLCGWMKQSAELLKHVVATMSDSLREGPFIQSDATGLPILEGRRNKPRRGHLWSYSDGCQFVFVATMNGKQEHPAQFLEGFSGTLLTDGAGAYNLVAKSDGITRAGCWAHARRKFFEARIEEPERVGIAMTQIREIFDLERQMTKLAPEAKAKERQKVLGEPLHEFRVWLSNQSTAVRPTSGLGKAITYTLNQWDTLVVFLVDGRAPVDNSASALPGYLSGSGHSQPHSGGVARRQLRGPVVGRKNWIFAGSEGGAHTAATLFSIVGSCVMAGIDPYAYLRDVLSLLPDATPAQLREFTPWACAQRFGDEPA
jgi:transposase